MLIQTYSNADTLAHAAAAFVVTAAQDAIKKKGQFSLVLSGGVTPRYFYRLLASDAYRDKVDWAKVHLFWDDERTVPPTHPDSNYRMSCETLVDAIPIPPNHVHRIHAELSPDVAAANYQTLIEDFFGKGVLPRFDLLLLGVGDDAHTASLFPHTAALNETKKWVVANYVPKLETWRITFTASLINHAAQILFVIEGAHKTRALAQILQGERDPQSYPAQLIQPNDGEITWLIDEKAGAELA